MEGVGAILELITRAGPYALFIVTVIAWRLERQERIDTQKSFRELMSTTLVALNETGNALKEFRYVFGRHNQD